MSCSANARVRKDGRDQVYFQQCAENRPASFPSSRPRPVFRRSSRVDRLGPRCSAINRQVLDFCLVRHISPDGVGLAAGLANASAAAFARVGAASRPNDSRARPAAASADCEAESRGSPRHHDSLAGPKTGHGEIECRSGSGDRNVVE